MERVKLTAIEFPKADMADVSLGLGLNIRAYIHHLWYGRALVEYGFIEAARRFE